MLFLSFAANHHIPLSPAYWSGDRYAKLLILCTMHKARLDIVVFTPAEKYQSAKWLLDNGFALPEHLSLEGEEVIGAQYEDE